MNNLSTIISDSSGQFTLSYFFPGETTSIHFMKTPKFFQQNPRFSNISINAIYLYSAMLDKLCFAATQQVDAEGRIYIDFSLEETCKLLKCSKTTAKKVRKELRDCFGENNGLVEFVSHGQGRNDYVYVKNYHTITSSESTLFQSAREPEIEPSREPLFEPSCESVFDLSRESKSIPNNKTNKETVKKDNIYHLSFTNQSPRKIDDDQHDILPATPVGNHSTSDKYTTALEAFKAQIGFDQLLCYAPDKTVLIGDLANVMAQEFVSSSEETIINGRHYSRADICDCLRSIDFPTARYVLDCLGRNNTKVVNIQRYILAALLNAPASFKAQKAYDDQIKQNKFLSHETEQSYSKPNTKHTYEPYHGRNYSDEDIHALELKKLGITG